MRSDRFGTPSPFPPAIYLPSQTPPTILCWPSQIALSFDSRFVFAPWHPWQNQQPTSTTAEAAASALCTRTLPVLHAFATIALALSSINKTINSVLKANWQMRTKKNQISFVAYSAVCSLFSQFYCRFSIAFDLHIFFCCGLRVRTGWGGSGSHVGTGGGDSDDKIAKSMLIMADAIVCEGECRCTQCVFTFAAKSSPSALLAQRTKEKKREKREENL